MDSHEDIRWKQRFSNFQKALSKLKEVVDGRDYETLSELEKEGLIQRFEYTFELAWKTLQDLLAFKGYQDIAGPNPALEQSFKDGYIQNEKVWRRMKKSRELTSHTYNSETADSIAESIVREYFFLLSELEQRLLVEITAK